MPRVTVIVRQGSRSSDPKTWIRLGHAALKASTEDGREIYVSLWPENCCNKSYDATGQREGSQSECNQAQAHIHTEDTDDLMYQSNEGRVLHHFYSLDVDKIDAEYQKFLVSSFSWSLFGSPLTGLKHQSCSSLVLTLLQAGGINNLLGSASRLKIVIKKWGVPIGGASALIALSTGFYLFSDSYKSFFSIIKTAFYQRKDELEKNGACLYPPYKIGITPPSESQISGIPNHHADVLKSLYSYFIGRSIGTLYVVGKAALSLGTISAIVGTAVRFAGISPDDLNLLCEEAKVNEDSIDEETIESGVEAILANEQPSSSTRCCPSPEMRGSEATTSAARESVRANQLWRETPNALADAEDNQDANTPEISTYGCALL